MDTGVSDRALRRLLLLGQLPRGVVDAYGDPRRLTQNAWCSVNRGAQCFAQGGAARGGSSDPGAARARAGFSTLHERSRGHDAAQFQRRRTRVVQAVSVGPVLWCDGSNPRQWTVRSCSGLEFATACAGARRNCGSLRGGVATSAYGLFSNGMRGHFRVFCSLQYCASLKMWAGPTSVKGKSLMYNEKVGARGRKSTSWSRRGRTFASWSGPGRKRASSSGARARRGFWAVRTAVASRGWEGGSE